MSSTNMDRTFQDQIGKFIQNHGNGRLGAAGFASAISMALRYEYGQGRGAIKTIASLTHANERAVKNWYSGTNGPSGEFLVLLCRHSDLVLETLLILANRSELLKVKKFGDAKAKLNEMLALLGELEQARH